MSLTLFLDGFSRFFWAIFKHCDCSVLDEMYANFFDRAIVCNASFQIVIEKWNGKIHEYWLNTLSEHYKLCPKIKFSEKYKIVNLLFFGWKSMIFWEFLNAKITWKIWIFAPKIVILFKIRINKISKLFNPTVFGAKIQNLTGNQCIRSLIFGTKIQVHNFVIFSKNWWYFWTEFEIF